MCVANLSNRVNRTAQAVGSSGMAGAPPSFLGGPAVDTINALAPKPGAPAFLTDSKIAKPPGVVDPTDEYIRQAGLHVKRKLLGAGGIESTFLTGKPTLGA